MTPASMKPLLNPASSRDHTQQPTETEADGVEAVNAAG